MSNTLYQQVGSPQETTVPLSLTFRNDVKPRKVAALAFAWTDDAKNLFAQLKGALNTPSKWGNIPYRGLRTLLELHVSSVLQLHDKGGFGDRDRSFVVLDGELTTREKAEQEVQKALDEWFVNELYRAAKDNTKAHAILGQLKTSHEEDRLVRAFPEMRQVYPWMQDGNGTAKGPTDDAFPLLASFIARQLEGKVIFEGLSPLRRVVSRYATFTQKQAELMTDPFNIPEGSFSLVLSLQVATFAGLGQPVIFIDVSKRRWITTLQKPYKSERISGWLLPTDSALAFKFSVQTRKSEEEYILQEDFLALASRYTLPTEMNGYDIVAGGANLAGKTWAGVNHKEDYSDHAVKAGVPEKDKLDAFRAALSVLEPLGFEHWHPLTLVKTENRASGGKTRLIHPEHSESADPKKRQSLQAYKGELKEMILRHHGHNPSILLAVHGSCEKDGETVKKHIADITDGLLKVHTMSVPEGAHGPRQLTDSDNASKRGTARIDTWKADLEQANRLKAQHNLIGALVLAPEKYEVDGVRRKDDSVNKLAGRLAFARIAKLPSQYLLPRKTRGNTEKDFEQRIQGALRDLIFAHYGVVAGVKDAVGRLFEHDTPTEIIGITAVQRNQRRRDLQGSFIALAFRLDPSTERAQIRFGWGRDNTTQLAMSGWLELHEGLLEIALKSRSLAKGKKNKGVRRKQLQEFYKTIIDEACQGDNRPLILLDSTHTAKYWGWLSDKEINSCHISFDAVSSAVAWQKARIFRIRENNAPRIVIDKTRGYAESGVEDRRDHKSLEVERRIQAPTSPPGNLYRVEEATLPTYLMAGGKYPGKPKRGTSCYRTLELTLAAREGDERLKSRSGRQLYRIAERAPDLDHHSSPNPIGVVLARLMRQDGADQAAEFVESLRSGLLQTMDWVTLPPPIFFERVVRDYIVEFSEEGV